MECVLLKFLNVYSGEFNFVLEFIIEIFKLFVYNFREILRFYNILDCGIKDEFIIRVGMLKLGRGYLVFYKEMEVMVDFVVVITLIIVV